MADSYLKMDGQIIAKKDANGVTIRADVIEPNVTSNTIILTLGNYKILYNSTDDTLDVEYISS